MNKIKVSMIISVLLIIISAMATTMATVGDDSAYTYPTATPTPELYSFDNIIVDHNIQLCDVVSDDERAITGEPLSKNCGKTVFTLNDHPLDVLPSGGNSGKVSDSEMVLVRIVTSGSMSILPWRTQTVNMNWYDGSDNRLIYSCSVEANNIDNYAGSLIGHFSWEINKPGKYYVDVNVVNWGVERLVFDVVNNDGIDGAVVTSVYTPNSYWSWIFG